MVERLLEAVAEGAQTRRTQPAAAHALRGLRPGSVAHWYAATGEMAPVAWAGAVHPELAAGLGIDAQLHVAEIDLDRLLALPRRPFAFQAVARVPSTSRDLSLVLPRGLAFERIRSVLGSVPAPAPVEWEVTDRYEGAPLAADEISLTVRGILQPLDRTLTDAETDSYRNALVEALLASSGIRLRE